MIVDLAAKQREAEHLIELIDRFPSSTQFFRWFAGKDLVIHTPFEKKSHTRFERVGNYYLDHLRVFSGGGEFFLDKTSKSFAAAIDQEKCHFYSLIAEVRKYKKVKMSSFFVWPQYTTASHFYHLDEVCGVCWEIYEIGNLLEIYRNRKIDPASIPHFPEQKEKSPTDSQNEYLPI